MENEQKPAEAAPIQPETTVAPVAPPAPAPTPTSTPQSTVPLPTYENPSIAAQQVPGLPAAPVKTSKRLNSAVLLAAGIIVICLVFFAAGYGIWHHSQATGKAVTSTMAKSSVATLTVPKGATVISQCEPGRGTQYVLPKDVPMGPIYNVYQSKVIGVEYMIPQSEVSTMDKVVSDLPLLHGAYDHLDFQLMSAHAGMPEPHFQVDVMLVTKSVSDKITCGATPTSNMSDNSSM